MVLSVTSLLKKYSIAPKKHLGQHFLAAMPTVEKIVASLEIKKDDSVLEIGPGLGLMTGLVAERAQRVFAIDTDASMIEIARQELAHHKNIVWINADILNYQGFFGWCRTGDPRLTPAAANPGSHSISDSSGDAANGGGRRQDPKKFDNYAENPIIGSKIKIIGNLPYNISSPIIFWMLENREKISEAIIMVQKEVALRLAAGPGNKDYGILSVLLQARADVKKLFDVSAKSFIPPPKVTSSVVRIEFKNDLHKIKDEAKFAAIVKAAFGKRRKTLRNALLGAKNLNLDPKKLDKILLECKIDGRRRPETLTVTEYIMMSDKFNAVKI